MSLSALVITSMMMREREDETTHKDNNKRYRTL
jgi:hypothetical protein